MGKLRTVEAPDSQSGDSNAVELTNLAWAMQYVLLKMQEMVQPSFIDAPDSMLSFQRYFMVERPNYVVLSYLVQKVPDKPQK